MYSFDNYNPYFPGRNTEEEECGGGGESNGEQKFRAINFWSEDNMGFTTNEPTRLFMPFPCTYTQPQSQIETEASEQDWSH